MCRSARTFPFDSTLSQSETFSSSIVARPAKNATAIGSPEAARCEANSPDAEPVPLREHPREPPWREGRSGRTLNDELLYKAVDRS